MSTFMEAFKQKYKTLSVGIDNEIDGWYLMQTPGPILSILVGYLIFVLKLGPALMKNRKPFGLQTVLVLYNACQVVFSAWLCSNLFWALSVESSTSTIFNNTCNNRSTVDRQFRKDIWSAAWWYFFAKIVDLLDTVFFVMRKKQTQVTFLHVYHHTITAIFSWGYLKYLPGEQGIVIGVLNSFVHIIMYFYYMLSAMGPKYQKYLWWKKYMTWVQLVQFCIMLFFLISITVMDCKLPKSLTYFFGTNCTIFLYLFGNFYRKSYARSGDKKVDSASLKNLGTSSSIMTTNYDSNNNSARKQVKGE